jgi:DNA gyrase subunit A
MLITRNGIVNRQRVNEIRVIGRATQGVRIMALDEGDELMDVARVLPEDEAVNGDGVVGADSPDSELAAAGGVLGEEIGEELELPGDE